MPGGREALYDSLLVPLTQEMTHSTVGSSRAAASVRALYL